MAVTVPTVRY